MSSFFCGLLVKSRMLDEQIFLVEFFMTNIALVILLAEMSPLVVLASSICLEALSTYFAVVRSQPSMSSLMVVPVGFLVEDLWAVSARIFSSFRSSLYPLIVTILALLFKKRKINFLLQFVKP